MNNRRPAIEKWAAIGSLCLVSIAAFDISFWYMLKIAILLSSRSIQ
jgi:hypothetical protein